MSRTPGPSHHHPGDGCTGEPRIVSLCEGYEIREGARVMLAAAAARAWHPVVSTGDTIALHYGPHGEWFLSSLLAQHVVHGAEPGQRPSGPPPQLNSTVPADDTDARGLLRHLAARHRQPTDPDTLNGAIRAARIPLQNFVRHFHAVAYPRARRIWADTYREDGPTPHLTALAFTSQLIVWSARCALTRTIPPHPRQQAHLN